MKAQHKEFLLISAGLALVLAASGCGAKTGTSSPAAPSAGESPVSASRTEAPAASTPAPQAPEASSGAPVADSPAVGALKSEEAPSPAAADLPAASESSPAPQAAPRRIGEIVFAEGTVLLHRGGEAPLSADIGQIVENFDVVQTGPKSRATLELGQGKPGGAEIRMAENTVFYYESALSDSGARKTVLQLMAGAVALKVEKLADGEFRVGSDGAVLGVRGTTFSVHTVPDGSLLVACLEGRVEVSDDSGSQLFAQPGRVVSQKPGEPVAEDLVSLENLADYRVAWVDESYRSLEMRASKVTAGYAKRYQETLPVFEAAYAKLREQGPVLDVWAVARETGGEPKFTDWIAEKKTVAPILFDCLSAMFKLERPFFRLQELSLLHDRGVGAGTLPDGRTTGAFFGDFGAKAPAVSEKLSYVRRALLLFKYASAGSPLGQFFGAKAEGLGSGALFLED